MSTLLKQPAVWPMLQLNPEPMGNATDPDSIERYYSEIFQNPPDPRPSEDEK